LNSSIVVTAEPEERHGVTFREAFWVWLRVAALSFGGPAGQIAVMHRILVEEKRWIGETRFLHALNYCMLLPGPEAQQLAVYIGWLLHRIPGGLVAGTLFILPGYISLMVLSWLYAAYGEIGPVQALFFGLKAAVLAIVVEAVFKVGKRALKNRVMIGLAGLSFITIFFFHASFPLIILAAAVIGFVGHATGFKAFSGSFGHGEAKGENDEPAAIDRAFSEQIPDHVRPSWTRAIKITVICLVLWLGPVVALVYTLGWDNVFSNIGLFFSKMAVITFGGAYAVLAYMAQQAVEYYHWLQPGEMLVGLGMAETTPGPLISVVQFVGFMAAFRHPGALDPMVAAAGRYPRQVDHLRSVLSLDFPGRTLHGSASRQQSIDRVTLCHHGGCRRRHSQPRGLVRHPYRLPRSRAGACFPVCVRCTDVLERRSLGPPAFGGSRRRYFPVQGRNDSDASSMLRRRHGSLLHGDALVRTTPARDKQRRSIWRPVLDCEHRCGRSDPKDATVRCAN